MKHSHDTDAKLSEESDLVGRPSAVTTAVWSRWIAPAGFAIGLLALILTLVQWFDPTSHGNGSPSFSDQQAKDAKTSICSAYTTVHRAVGKTTHLESPPDGGPLGPLTVATSARLALYGGGGYLRDRLTKEPATPTDVAKAVDSLATTLEDLAMNYLAGAPGITQDQLRHNLDEQLESVAGLCK